MSSSAGSESSHLRAAGVARGFDVAIGLALFGATVAYWIAWPHNLGYSDEAHFLYHSRRVFEGQIPYRDFFDFHTPLALYVMALGFKVFGAQLATAKAVAAAIHGLTVVLVFVSARRIGAGRAVAWCGALFYLALGPSTWPYASPHWMGTLVLVALLAIGVGRPLRRVSLLALGALCGVLFSMQQQTGVPIAMGIGALIVIESLLDRRFGTPGEIPLGTKLGWFCGAGLAVALPVLAIHVALAGWDRVFDALVVHPLFGYRTANRAAWGDVHFMNAYLARYTFPALLQYLPLTLVPLAIGRVWLGWRASDRTGLETVVTLSVFSVASAATVVNRPDFIHLAYVIAVFVVFATDCIRHFLAALPSSSSQIRRGVAVVAASLAALAVAVQLRANLESAHDYWNLPHDTAFGQVAFDSADRIADSETVRSALDGAPSRDLFCHPLAQWLFLTANGNNPTRHEVLIPTYKTPEHFEEALAVLERERVPHIVVSEKLLDPATDPVFAYVRDNYRCAVDVSPCWLYRRMD